MTENERFTLFYEKIGKYFTMGIVDHETDEPFDTASYEFNQCSFKDSKDEMEDLCLLMNQLADENKSLKKQLEYIQNSINKHIKHQKTELGQKALQKVIEDYNEWLLGHTRRF